LIFVHPELEHYQGMADLANKVLSINYMSSKQVSGDPGAWYIALIDDELAGMIQFDIYSREPEPKPGAIIMSVAVDHAFRGRGIATEMISHVIDTELRPAEVHDVYAYAWVPNGKSSPNLKIPLERNGFTPFQRLEKHWYHEPKTNQRCLYCGWPCECDAVQYRLLINTKTTIITTGADGNGNAVHGHAESQNEKDNRGSSSNRHDRDSASSS
jgi:RimJ/RimL family protein N-acetyltransferase